MRDEYYSHYFVAFIDVLGQRDVFRHVTGLPKEGPEYEQLMAAIQESAGFVRLFRKMFLQFYSSIQKMNPLQVDVPQEDRYLITAMRDSEIRCQYLSDFFVSYVSCLADEPEEHCIPLNSIFGILTACGHSFLFSLFKNHSVRGGITLDTAFELNDKEIYGRALNGAYEYESVKALYPRILVGDEVVRYLQAFIGNPQKGVVWDYCRAVALRIQGLLTQDIDGYYVIDFLSPEFMAQWQTPLGYKPDIEEDLTYENVLRGAFKYVSSEYERWKNQRHSRNADGYVHLMNYFYIRLGGHEKYKEILDI